MSYRISIFLVLAIMFPVCLSAAPQYHDYSQYPHLNGSFFTQDDDITSVSFCQIQGTTYCATTGQISGLSFFALHADSLEIINSHQMPGVQQGAIFQDMDAYVITRPNRVTKFFIYSPTNPVEIWTDLLPGNPLDIVEFGDYLLLACGEDGLLVYDPTTMFNLPVGVVATLPGTFNEIIAQGTMLVVRTGQELKTFDFTDPLNPAELGSIDFGFTRAMAVIGDLAYVSSGEDVNEVDISDPTDLIHLRTMSHSFDHYQITAIFPSHGGLNLSAGAKMHFLDLVSGTITFSRNDFPRGLEMAQYGDFLVMAAGVYGFHVYGHRAPVYAPSSDPFGPEGTLKSLQIEGDFLFGYFGNRVECYNLAGDEPDLAWIHEAPLNNEYVKALVVEGDRVFIGYNNGMVRILEYAGLSKTQLAYFQSGSEVVYDLGPLPGHLAVFGDPSDDIYRQRVLEVYNLNGGGSPTLVTSLEDNDFPRMTVTGNTIILWDYTSSDYGAKLIDAVDPGNLLVANTFQTPSFSELTVKNNMVYLVEPPFMQAVDISNPYNIQFGPEVFIDRGWYLEINGQYGYLLYTDLVFDLSDPLRPVPIGSSNNEWVGTVHYCAAGDGYLVVGDSANLVLMAEQGTPTSPVIEAVPEAKANGLVAFPNPFNPQVQLEFNMASAGVAGIEIFDMKGRRVARWDLEVASPGPAMASWNGRNSAGQNLPSGVYLVQILTDQSHEIGKVVLAR